MLKTETKWEIGNRALIVIAVLFYAVLFCWLMQTRNRNKDRQQLIESFDDWMNSEGISNAVVNAHVAGWQAREQGWSKERLIETVNNALVEVAKETKGE